MSYLRAMGSAALKTGYTGDRHVGYVNETVRSFRVMPCKSNLQVNDGVGADREKHQGMSSFRNGPVAWATAKNVKCHQELLNMAAGAVSEMAVGRPRFLIPILRPRMVWDRSRDRAIQADRMTKNRWVTAEAFIFGVR